MVELQHRTTPTPLLTDFVAACPELSATDFDTRAFTPVKQAIKADLNEDQGGLCVYCEKTLPATEGQIDHIKPKAGTNGRPDLCFVYHNYAHSCINPKTCGQKKQNGLLPIEPGPGCNAEWVLSTDGTIEPLPELTRRRRHDVIQTRDMLGLQDANLVDERRRWFASAITILKQAPDDFSEFLQHAPYRHILATAF